MTTAIVTGIIAVCMCVLALAVAVEDRFAVDARCPDCRLAHQVDSVHGVATCKCGTVFTFTVHVKTEIVDEGES